MSPSCLNPAGLVCRRLLLLLLALPSVDRPPSVSLSLSAAAVPQSLACASHVGRRARSPAGRPSRKLSRCSTLRRQPLPQAAAALLALFCVLHPLFLFFFFPLTTHSSFLLSPVWLSPPVSYMDSVHAPAAYAIDSARLVSVTQREGMRRPSWRTFVHHTIARNAEKTLARPRGAGGDEKNALRAFCYRFHRIQGALVFRNFPN